MLSFQCVLETVSIRSNIPSIQVQRTSQRPIWGEESRQAFQEVFGRVNRRRISDGKERDVGWMIRTSKHCFGLVMYVISWPDLWPKSASFFPHMIPHLSANFFLLNRKGRSLILFESFRGLFWTEKLWTPGSCWKKNLLGTRHLRRLQTVRGLALGKGNMLHRLQRHSTMMCKNTS